MVRVRIEATKLWNVVQDSTLRTVS